MSIKFAPEQQRARPGPRGPILVVEDSDEDFEAFMRVLRRLPEPDQYQVLRCRDGDECLDYLSSAGEFAHPPAVRPSIILLDLNLPGVDGREILDHLDQTPSLRSIPVTVLTTSTNQEDVQLCYQKGANSYTTKSLDWGQYEIMIKGLMAFWFSTVILPEESSQPG